MKKSYDYANIQNGYAAIAHAEEGAKFLVCYMFGGNTLYTVGRRGSSKKVLRSEGDYRGHVITGPASVKKILGAPRVIEEA